MTEIKFTKMVASGNDFVVVENELAAPSLKPQALVKNICDRKFGIGADGILLLGRSRSADVKMRIFNADGSQAKMCGNGARCAAFFVMARGGKQDARIKIETKAGIIDSEIAGDKIKVRLTDPRGIKLGMPIKMNNRFLKVNFINTGVPHAVIFVEGLNKIDIVNLGRDIRHHSKFAPAGTNVDFVEVLSNDSIKLRTYERGVEDETLACGTGSAAAALITDCLLPISGWRKINVHTEGKEVLKVYFKKTGNRYKEVWLEGKVRIVYKGVYYV